MLNSGYKFRQVSLQTRQWLLFFIGLQTRTDKLRYLLIFKDSEVNLSNDKLDCILYLIEKYKHKNDTKLLTIISLFVELFYKDLSMRKNNNFNMYSINKYKILKQINDAKQFNLDKNNLFTSLTGILQHESK